MAQTPRRLPSPLNLASLLGQSDGEEARLLAPPPAPMVAWIASHLAEEHGIAPFSLAEHVYLGDGARLASQLISWDSSRQSFRCQACPGRVYWSGEVSDDAVDRLLRFNRSLAPLLVGVRSVEERREIGRAWLSGELGDELRRPLRKRRRRQPAAPRPSVEHRRRAVQRWMLNRYRERGVLERVIEDALRLHRERPDEWARLSDRAPVASTLRRYWQQIPDDQVAAAKADYQARHVRS